MYSHLYKTYQILRKEKKISLNTFPRYSPRKQRKKEMKLVSISEKDKKTSPPLQNKRNVNKDPE